jgi:rhodanese-related sulfurtransferase
LIPNFSCHSLPRSQGNPHKFSYQATDQVDRDHDSGWAVRARDEFQPVSRGELLDRLRSGTATVLDVRPEDEFASGHLPNALNIPLSQLERRLAELPADQEIVAYCRGPWCVLSFEAVAVLRQRGYRVRRLEDGFPEWKLAGLPIESVPVR